MATMTSSAASQAQNTTATRERLSLAPWTELIEGTMAIRLSSVNFLPGDGTHKASFSGMLEAPFVDPVTGEAPTFTDAKGVTRPGKCPVRLLGLDGLAVHAAIGIEQDKHLLLGLKPDADVSVYRTEGGSVAFLVLRLSSLTGERAWQDAPLPDFNARAFGA